ncbi:MAG TPA: NDP-sugar synthase [Phycisphaerae bacterium]|nr:NDP-sugar synthase [Phycisphaerae bacterium]
MKAVMLAGDCGYAQNPLAAAVPRGLWPVFDRPAASHLVDQLRALGCQGVGVCANGNCSLFAEALDGCVADAAALAFVEDQLPRGAAGCVADVASKVGRDRFIVLQTNMLWDTRLPNVLTHHIQRSADLTVVVTPNPNDASLRPAGIYILEPCVFDFIQPTSYQDIKEQVIPAMVKAGRRVEAFALPEGYFAWHDTSTYLDALGRALACPEHFGISLASMREVAPSVHVAPSAEVSPSARIYGPAAVLGGASIQPGAVIVGPVVVGPGSRIGRSAVITESILWSGATIENDCYVSCSVIGDGVTVTTAAMNCAVLPSHRERRWRRWHDGTVQPGLPRMSVSIAYAQRPEAVGTTQGCTKTRRRPTTVARTAKRTEAVGVPGN